MIPAEQVTVRGVAGEVPGATTQLLQRHLVVCTLLCLVSAIFAWDSVRLILNLIPDSDTYTHIPLIPLVSIFLICSERRSIFSDIEYSWPTGITLMAPGAVAIGTAKLNIFHLGPSNQLCLVLFGLVLMWIGAFGFSWGTRAFRAARFPLVFLLFMVPIPEPLLSKSILLLQEGSAKATAVVFGLYGIPFLQDGLVFSLPGIAIRVAEECSGIRSTLALLIMTVLASRIFLKTTWKQVLVCLLVVPLSIAKNGLRIATLSALAVYVNPEYLTGSIHHQFGGMLFFAAAFIPIALLFVLLQKTESPKQTLARRV